MRRRPILTLLFACALGVHAAVASGAELIVSAAASLANAFRDAGKRFEDTHPGDKVIFNFASSDVLLAQVAKGAPVDVFATADAESMDRAEAQGLLLAGSRETLVANTLTLIVPSTAKTAISSIAGLEGAAVKRIAIGNPASVPAGRYAKEALEQAGAWSKLEAKFIMAQNVRQTLDYVARGEVDAGFVYATDAAVSPDKVRVAAVLPTKTPIIYPIALIKDSRQRALGAAFVASLAAPEARATFTRYGFSLPP
jgi:molybdate transport system substrate-binding protein